MPKRKKFSEAEKRVIQAEHTIQQMNLAMNDMSRKLKSVEEDNKHNEMSLKTYLERVRRLESEIQQAVKALTILSSNEDDSAVCQRHIGIVQGRLDAAISMPTIVNKSFGEHFAVDLNNLAARADAPKRHEFRFSNPDGGAHG